MIVIFPLHVNSPKYIHTLSIYTSFMMGQRPGGLPLLIYLLPIEPSILLRFVYFMVFKVLSFVGDEVVKIEHLEITVFSFFNVLTSIDEHFAVIDDRGMIASFVR
jgi:hypothetical protein